ncbi:MAG: SH3 domain-containing C40 family peptidase, partial [Firmicutes bacterium]|nr:SH3 domain-containing C40 family peptidase [Bacillota bacterium]
KRYLKLIVLLVFTLSIVFTLASSASATELKTGIGIVEARGGLRLREKPSTSADVITVAQKGDTVVVIRQVDDWYLVNYNLHIGYMHGDYLTVKARENVELGTGSVDASLVNLRNGPSTSTTMLEQLKAGEEVEIFGFNSGWYKVRYEGQIGYIRSDLVTLLEKPLNNTGRAATSSDDETSSGSTSTEADLGQQIATYAQQFVGYPYVYGGSSPSGFDCSGFMQYVFSQFGYSINRTATAQLANGYSVAYEDLRPGDIIYFGYGSTASHVGMYIGNGQFVHAENSSTGVVITDLSVSWYANRYLCAHRIVG